MYNLFRFLVRYHLLLLFIVLEVFCFVLIFRNSKYHEAAYVNVANEASGKVYQTYKTGIDYFYLRRYNDSLVAENARLREQLLESKFDNKADTGSASDSTKRFVQNYTYITARVIMNTVNKPTNFIYLDKGARHGLKKEMGVIAASGVVGQVINVTENYAVARSALSKDSRVSVRFKNNDFVGNVHWDGGSSAVAILDDIPKHVPVKVGDTLLTSGFSQLYPRNVMVGVVKTVSAQPDKNFQDITVRLSTNFGSLTYVYVVNNIRKQEIQLLDSLAIPTPPKP